MKRTMALVSTAILIAFGAATPVLAKDTLRFEAELHQFSPPVGPCEAGVCELVSYGYGSTNLMGAVNVTGEVTWDFNTTPCNTIDPLVLTLAGATGSLTISGSGFICPFQSPSGFPQSFSGLGEVTDATGEFSGIGGSVSFQGVLAKRGPGIHVSGSLSY